MKIKPLAENILIKRLKSKDSTSSGVLLVTKDSENEQAEIVSVSSEVKKVKKGDKILFKNYAVDTVEIDGVECSFIKLENIIAIIK